MEHTIQIFGLSDHIAHCEAMGLSHVFKAYAIECNHECIESIGFNPNSGYVYIALSNGISICSCMGQKVEFLVTDFNTGNEFFFDSYEEAINHEFTEEEETEL